MRLLPLTDINESTLSVGMSFCKDHTIESRNKTITVHTIEFDNGRQLVTYSDFKGRAITRSVQGFISSLRLNEYFYVDESGQSNGFTMPTFKVCPHFNVRSERYFSGFVYETCKDCGQALNKPFN